MNEYKVLNETGVVVEGTDAPHAVGDIIQLDPESEVTKKWLADGIVELMPHEGELGTENGGADAQKDTDSGTDEGKPLDEGNDGGNATNVATDETNASAAVAGGDGQVDAGATAPTPVLMYRGKRIIKSEPRTVQDFTFQAITLESGEVMDLTEQEYKDEVKVA